LSRLFEFGGGTLCQAVRNTFERRSTPLPDGLPFAFSDAFRKDTQKQTQWRAFVSKAKPDMIAGDLDAVVGDVSAFLRPVIEALLQNSSFELVWVQGGPWGGCANK